jgi:putative flippase GtrA
LRNAHAPCGVDTRSVLSRPDSILQRLKRFGTSIAVGAAATAVDFVLLSVLARVFGVEPTRAKIVSFLGGLSVQFLGNRTFTFRARSGSVRAQAALFFTIESVTLCLHWLLFRFFVRQLRLPIELANLLVGFLVFSAFSFPLWHYVFRVPSPTVLHGEAASAARAAGADHDDTATK